MSSMANETDARTCTSTGTKSHIITLNNYLNITNAMVSLMAPSASFDGKHVIVTYMTKLIC